MPPAIVLVGVALVVFMAARRKVTPRGIEELGFVDVDGSRFDVPDDAQLAELEPTTRSKVTGLLRMAREAGLDVGIVPRTGARRSPEQQAKAVAEGNSQLKDGPHLYGAAVDLMFRGPSPFAESHPWQRLGELGEACGLTWGGRWKTLKDLGHFERKDWRTLRALV